MLERPVLAAVASLALVATPACHGHGGVTEDAGRAATPPPTRANDALALSASSASVPAAEPLRDMRVTTSTDPWLSTATDCDCAGDSDELPEAQYVRLPEAVRPVAEAKLDWSSVVQLQDEEVVTLTVAPVDRRAVRDAMTRAARDEARALDAEVADLLLHPGPDVARQASLARTRAEAARARATEAARAQPSALRAYLVRGMALRCAGGPNVQRCGDRGLEVWSHCMGAHPSPASRAPLVVFLLQPPLRVCVRVGMTE